MVQDTRSFKKRRTNSFGGGSKEGTRSSHSHKPRGPNAKPGGTASTTTTSQQRKDRKSFPPKGNANYQKKKKYGKEKPAKASLRQFAWIAAAKRARRPAQDEDEGEDGADGANPSHAIDVKGKGKAETIEIDEPTTPPRTFKIVAGSYEKLLYGIEGSFGADAASTSRFIPTFKPIFIFPAHVGCVKTMSASPKGGKWLATSSTDEIIKVWDLRRRKEVGALVHHTGTFCLVRLWFRSK